jgi:hypothetical protein
MSNKTECTWGFSPNDSCLQYCQNLHSFRWFRYTFLQGVEAEDVQYLLHVVQLQKWHACVMVLMDQNFATNEAEPTHKC